jgi:hypothetical protein
MADYAMLQVAIGAYFKIAQKSISRREHARLADNANYDRRLPLAANGFDTSDNEENKAYGNLVAYLDQTVVQSAQTELVNFRSLMEGKENLFGVIAAEIAPSKEDADAGAIEYEYEDVDGVISIAKRKGMLGALYRQMQTDGYYVAPNAVSNGGLTAQAGNSGALTGTTLTFLGHTPSGVMVFECVDATVAAPKFKVSLRIDTASILGDGTDYLEADNQLTLEKSFSDGPTGCSTLVLSRSGLASPTESGDNNALISGMTFTSPQDADCDDGVFYLTVDRTIVGASSNIWLIQFYNASSRTGETKVGQVITDGTSGTPSLSLVLQNGTLVNFTFDRAAAHAAIPTPGATPDHDISYDISTPAVGDKWTLAITNDYAGNFQTKALKLWRFSFPVSGSTQFTDSNAATVSMA